MGSELIAPISPAGLWLETAPLAIDLAHRTAVLHKGVWLFVVSADDMLLIAQRNAAMATCPGTLTVIGEHHNGRESDAACARRALREELPGLASLSSSLFALRRAPRWFLYDYAPLADGISRRDRCLISEYVVELRANASEALERVRVRGAPEAASVSFQSISEVRRMLRRRPERFCARELYPSCLLDSLADLVDTLGTRGRTIDHGARRVDHGRAEAAMLEAFDPSRVVRSAASAAS